MAYYEKEAKTMVTARNVDGKWIPVESKTIVNRNVLKIEIGTNGFCGGDAGHGCRTYFSLIDESGTDIRVDALSDGVEIVLGGDAELQTFVEALTFAAAALKKRIEESRDENMSDGKPSNNLRRTFNAEEMLNAFNKYEDCKDFQITMGDVYAIRDLPTVTTYGAMGMFSLVDAAAKIGYVLAKLGEEGQ